MGEDAVVNADELRLITDFTMSFIETYGEKIYRAIKGKIKSEWGKFKADLNIGLKKYYEKAYEKYSLVKTVLYKTEPKPLYDFFEIPYVKKGSDSKFLVDSVNKVLDISRFIIISGTGGIGKSTLMRHLFISGLKTKELIPIIIELKDINSINNDYDFQEFLFQKFNDLGGGIDKECIDYSLSQGYFLFLLDGYDEIYSTQRDSFFTKFEAFCDRYPDNYYVISSRPFDEFISMQRFTVLEAMPFTKKQSIALVNRMPYEVDTKKRFVNQLNEGLYKKHKSFASNPLLLCIMLLTFENYAEIPNKLHLFYANAFETLFEKHDATKSGYRREFRSKLPFDSFKKVFSMFCFMTYAKGIISFTRDELYRYVGEISKRTSSFNVKDFIFDLLNSLCVMHIEGTEYCFTHRSFQEYFTAFFLQDQPDTIFKKLGLELIERDVFRAAEDNVFPMLHDMAETRFERNLLLPILDDIDKNIVDTDPYDFYFIKAVNGISFIHKEDGELALCRSVSANNRVEFCSKYIWKYPHPSIDSEDNAEKELYDYLISKGCPSPFRINREQITSDGTLYSIVRKTWIGHWVFALAGLRQVIINKQQSAEIDLDSILAFEP